MLMKNHTCVCGEFINIYLLKKLDMPFERKVDYLMSHKEHISFENLNEKYDRCVMPMITNVDNVCNHCRLLSGCIDLVNRLTEVAEYDGHINAMNGNPEDYFEEALACPRVINIIWDDLKNRYRVFNFVTDEYDELDDRFISDNEEEYKEVIEFCPVRNNESEEINRTKCNYGLFYPYCFVKEGCPKMKEKRKINE